MKIRCTDILPDDIVSHFGFEGFDVAQSVRLFPGGCEVTWLPSHGGDRWSTRYFEDEDIEVFRP